MSRLFLPFSILLNKKCAAPNEAAHEKRKLRLSLHKSLTKPIRDGCQVGGCVFAKSKTHPARTSLVFDLCSRNIIPYPAAACKPSRYVFSSNFRYSMIQYEPKKAGGKPMATDCDKTAPSAQTSLIIRFAQKALPRKRLSFKLFRLLSFSRHFISSSISSRSLPKSFSASLMGAAVVMSTPASFSMLMGSMLPPAERNFL